VPPLHHPFRTTSGPAIRLSNGKVAAMIASDAAMPTSTVAALSAHYAPATGWII